MSNRSDAELFPARVAQLFGSPLGQDVMAEMEARYCRRVFDDNANRMAFNVGQNDLVQDLKELTEERVDG